MSPLRDGGEAGDGAVVGGILSVSALEDENSPSFEEPVVLLIPLVPDTPLDNLFDPLEHRLLDWRALLDGEGVHIVNPACLPRR